MHSIELRLQEKHAELKQRHAGVEEQRYKIRLEWLDRSHHIGRVDVEPTRDHAQEKTAHQTKVGHNAVVTLAVGIFTWLTAVSVGSGHELLYAMIAVPVGILFSLVVDTGVTLATGAKSGDFSSLKPIKWIAGVSGSMVGSSFALFLAMRFSQDHQLLSLFPVVVLMLEAGLFGLAGAASSAHRVYAHDGELCDKYEHLGRQSADLALAVHSCEIQLQPYENMHKGAQENEIHDPLGHHLDGDHAFHPESVHLNGHGGQSDSHSHNHGQHHDQKGSQHHHDRHHPGSEAHDNHQDGASSFVRASER